MKEFNGNATSAVSVTILLRFFAFKLEVKSFVSCNNALVSGLSISILAFRVLLFWSFAFTSCIFTFLLTSET